LGKNIGVILREYKIIKQIGLIGFINLLVSLSSLLLIPVLTKNTTTQDYGIYVQTTVTIGLISNIITLGLPYAMVRFLASEKDIKIIKDDFYSVTSFILMLSVLTGIILLVFSNYISIMLFSGNNKILYLLVLIVILNTLNIVLLNYFRTFQKMKKYSLFYFLQSFITLVLAIFFSINDYSIVYIVSSILISNFIIFLLMLILILNEIKFTLPKFKNIRKYLDFGLPTLPSSLSYLVIDSVDRYIIGIFMGLTYVGYYNPAYVLGNVIMILTLPFTTVLLPSLSENYDQNNLEQTYSLINFSLKSFLILAIPAAAGISILAKPMLIILTTEEIALNSFFVTPFVAIGTLILGTSSIIGNAIILKNKTKILGVIWLFGGILNFLLNIFLVKIIGIVGAAFSTLLSYVFISGIIYYYSLKMFDLKIDWTLILKIIIATSVMSLIIIQIKSKELYGIISLILLSIILYILMLFILKVIGKKEIKILRNIF